MEIVLTYQVDLNTDEPYPPAVPEIGVPTADDPDVPLQRNPFRGLAVDADGRPEVVPPTYYGFERVAASPGLSWWEIAASGTYILTDIAGIAAPETDEGGWRLALYPNGYDGEDEVDDPAWEVVMGPDGTGKVDVYPDSADPVATLRETTLALCKAVEAHLKGCSPDGSAETYNASVDVLLGAVKQARKTAESFYGWE